MYDCATTFRDALTTRTKSSEDTTLALIEVLGDTIPKIAYSDNADEIKIAIRQLAPSGRPAAHSTRTPHIPQTMGVGDRIIGIIAERTKMIFKASGLPH